MYKNFFIRNFHRITIPPLLPITLCCIIGITFHLYVSLFCAFFVAIILLCTCLAYTKQIKLPQQLLLCSFFMWAGPWLYHKELRDYEDFYSFVDNKKMTVTGTIIDTNTTTVNHQKTTVITLAPDIIATTEHGIYKSNKIVLFYTKSNKSLVVGDTVTFFDIRCKKPSSQDFQHYHIKEQILATCFENNLNFRIDYHPAWSLRNRIWHHKNRLLDCAEKKFSSRCFHLFSSLFLGNRAYVKASLEETNEQFKSWGIYHFIARSGLHLALFICVWQALFCIIPLPLLIKQIIFILISCIYALLTWSSTPFTRSFALFVLNKFCLLSKKPFYTLHYLTLICFCFLLYCPLYLIFLDFQLTFALTCALVWFNQVTTQHRESQLKY